MRFLQLTILFSALVLLSACSNAPKGEKAKTTEATAPATAATTSNMYMIDKESTLSWTGAKIGGEHTGTIAISGGSLAMKDNAIESGTFTIDMGSLVNTDLEGEMKANLEGHLKSEDFFDVAKYPNSTFEITKAITLVNSPKASHQVSGNLTIKDVTKQVTFRLQVEEAGGKLKIAAPSFTIDRTDFGVKYGSNKFFDDLKDKAINDEIAFTINATASSK